MRDPGNEVVSPVRLPSRVSLPSLLFPCPFVLQTFKMKTKLKEKMDGVVQVSL